MGALTVQPATMEVAPATVNAELLETVLLRGDLTAMKPPERMNYYRAVCSSLGLNPLTRPFDYLTLNGKTILYAKRECTEQLRKIHGISLTIMDRSIVDDVYVVTARAKDRYGREDESTGAVAIGNLKGEAKANALMKAETKAKRRVTLSICGLAFMDETEADSTPGLRMVMNDEGEFVGQEGNSAAAQQEVAVARIRDLAAADAAPPVGKDEARGSQSENAGGDGTPATERKPRKVTGAQIDFLKEFAQLKKDLREITGGDAEYYSVLNENGYEKSSSITSKEEARRMWKLLANRLNDWKIADQTAKANANG